MWVGFICELMLVEMSDIVIGNKMNRGCIGRYGWCKLWRVLGVGSDCWGGSCYKEWVGVERKEVDSI